MLALPRADSFHQRFWIAFISQQLAIHVVLTNGSAIIPFLHNCDAYSAKHRIACRLTWLWRKNHTPVILAAGCGMLLA
jgi:hypothetical protein